MITAKQIQKKYGLGRSQTWEICKRARWREAELVKGNIVPIWKYRKREIALIIDSLKDKNKPNMGEL
jgi:hypothetical protein